ncbi:hypothetical protein [Roseivirga misakiensis]|uniref:Uncharacterized protein n=1 Tax=Roseivirga misakiensis TaxID=1563681 RepID=A0A1E5T816_9BACT|nr:hypothetical protein [Roseivirga misakiensis]OEK07457.1 hypothetical protein BFP71_00165 [Roseivirga misakiensis]
MKKKITLLSIALVLTAFAFTSIQAYQSNDEEQVQGYKLKTKENGTKKVEVNVQIDENEQGGSASIGTSTNISGVVRYCKSRNRKSCPKKYL